MSLFNFISKQFIDVIQWTAEEPGILAYRYPMQDMEIQNGAQLVVRDTQMAAFLNEGKVADIFGPGTHTLNTQTLPVLTYLQNWDKFFESPFKSDVYFFNMREQTDQKWGTTQPITVRDKEFGPLRIRAFGSYSYAVSDLALFWGKLVGTAESYSVEDASGQLRAAILTSLSTFLANSGIPFIDMAANQEEFSRRLQEAAAPALASYGLAIKTFYVQSLSLPEELERYLDKVSAMRMVGDLQKYAHFQSADAITTAAENPGGVAGAGAGLGAGLAIGQAMMQNLGNSGAPAQATVPQPAPPAEDPIALLERLGALVEKGVLTKEEFAAKKAELLARIR
jgi:membrane protease subunit (stomatin/prohibitin family)